MQTYSFPPELHCELHVDPDSDNTLIVNPLGDTVAIVGFVFNEAAGASSPQGLAKKAAIAARLVAVWNACISMPTEALEQPEVVANLFNAATDMVYRVESAPHLMFPGKPQVLSDLNRALNAFVLTTPRGQDLLVAGELAARAACDALNISDDTTPIYDLHPYPSLNEKEMLPLTPFDKE